MKTRKKISRETMRQLLRWRLPKRTRKQFHRTYHGTFLNDMIEPLQEIYSKKNFTEKINTGCYFKKVKVVPYPKKKTYVWRISGGLFHWI